MYIKRTKRIDDFLKNTIESNANLPEKIRLDVFNKTNKILWCTVKFLFKEYGVQNPNTISDLLKGSNIEEYMCLKVCEE